MSSWPELDPRENDNTSDIIQSYITCEASPLMTAAGSKGGHGATGDGITRRGLEKNVWFWERFRQ